MRNGVIRGCLIVAFSLCFVLLANIGGVSQDRAEPQPSSHQTQQKAEADKRTTLDVPLIIKSLPSEKNQQETDDDARDKSEKRWNDRVTIFLSIATAVILAFQLIVFGWQAHRLKQTVDTMKELGAQQSADAQASIAITKESADAAKLSADIAEKTLIASQRPWLTVEVGIGGPLIYDERGASFIFTLLLENIGKSPAQDIFIDLGISAPAIGNDPSGITNYPLGQKLDEMMERNKRKMFPGFAIFPNKSVSKTIEIAINSAALSVITEHAPFISPDFFGIISYSSDLSDRRHRTGFRCNIRRWTGGIFPADILPADGNIAAEELIITRDTILGDFAD